jgi:hypothetical protein
MMQNIEQLDHYSHPSNENEPDRPSNGRELLEVLRFMDIVGMWKDRTDIGDSSEFAERLRERSTLRGSTD